MTKRNTSVAMIILGVGMVVFALSDYSAGGWALSCRYMMSIGAMLATGGKLLA